MFDKSLFKEPSRTFYRKTTALEYIAESDDDSLHLFAFDSSDVSGPKGFYAASLQTIFKTIYLNFPVLRKDGRNILYEGIENHQACALAIDLDLKTSDTHLEAEDNCDHILLQVIDRIERGFKELFSIEITIKDWLVTNSPYSFEKQKHSYHFLLTGYTFSNIDDVGLFIKEIDAADLGIDLAIYRVGCLRLVGCTKKGQDRTLTPYKLMNTEGGRTLLPRDFETPFDYFKASTVLHVEGYAQITIPNELRLQHRQRTRTAPPRSPKEKTSHEEEGTGADHSQYFEVPFDLLRQVIDALDAKRADDREMWSQAVWAIFVVSRHNSYLTDGLELAHDFSKRSDKYCRHAVNDLWEHALPYGLNWPSIRSWLCQDNRPVWSYLRTHNTFKKLMFRDMSATYRQQYLPHVDQYRDVVTNVVEYNASAVPPFDLDNNHCVIEHSGMGTRKTQRYVELVLSGKYRSILLLVNRQTLTRASIQRLNYAIREHMGIFDPSKLFRDYRRAEEVKDPFEIPDDTSIDITDHYSISRIPEPSVFLSDSNDEDETWEEEVSDNAIDDCKGQNTDEGFCIAHLGRGNHLMSVKRLVMQMESCHRIAGRKFDLVIADECESDIYQLSSNTMKRLKDSATAFYQILKDAGKILFLDAFPTDRQFLLLRHLDFPKATPITYRHNSWMPSGRTAIEIDAETTLLKKKLMFEAIRSKLKSGKRVAVFTTSRACGLELVKFITQHFADKKVIAFYDKLTDSRIRDRDFDNVDKWWIDVDLLIYTPVLLAGVSFNVKAHFHCLFIWAYSQSSHVRDIIQAAGRVRHFEIETMFYALDCEKAQGNRGLPLTYDVVKAGVDAQGELIKRYHNTSSVEMPVTHVDTIGKLIGDLRSCPKLNSPECQPEHRQKIEETLCKLQYTIAMEDMPAWLLDVHVRNKWEQYLTHNPKSFGAVFEDFLKLAGWEREGTLTEQDIINWENSMRVETGRRRKPASRVSLPDISRKYADIPVLTAHQFEDCKKRQARGTTKEIENLALERYWFDSCIATTLGREEAKEAVFNEMIDDTKKKQIMINLYCEETCKTDELASRALLNNPYPETTDTLPTILKLLRRLCNELGLKSTYDFDGSFTSTVLLEKHTILQPIVKDLIEIMQIRPSVAGDPTLVVQNAIHNAFKKFSGNGVTSNRIRRGGQQYYEMKIKPNMNFTNLVLEIL